MNGCGNGSVVPSMVTWPSCMASSRADCVLAGARRHGRGTGRSTGGGAVAAAWLWDGELLGVGLDAADEPRPPGDRGGGPPVGVSGKQTPFSRDREGGGPSVLPRGSRLNGLT